MRRKDREIVDSSQIDEIIRKSDICRLGFNDNGKVYIVPLNFGFEHENNVRTFYFHSATEGRKVNLIKQGGNVCFELDTNYLLHAAETAFGFSSRFQSVIGNGEVSEVVGDAEKLSALQSIMFNNSGKRDWEITQEQLDVVFVFKVVVEEIACKNHD